MNSDVLSKAIHRSIATLLVVLAAIVLNSAVAKAHLQPTGASRTTAPPVAQMSIQSTKLDAGHEQLARLVGEYTRVVKFLGQSGAMAKPSYGTSKFSPVLGGRFVLETSHDVVFGKPVDALRIYGYIPATKQYQMARMYTMSDTITMMNGTTSDGGKTIVYAGEAGSSGTRSMLLRATLRWINKSEFTVTMSSVSASGKDSPFQETIYTRKK